MAGQSNPHLSLFSAPEVEFLAEDEVVEIVPNIKMDAVNMICGDFGPFFPQIATKVPLWLAVALKKRGKCSVRPPEWMSVERLTHVLEAERESPREFQPLPFHYVEMSKLLLDNAHEDIPDIYMVRSLIEDIRDVRFHKVETGLETISGRTHAVKLKNLSAMEVNIVRPFMVRALQAFYKHDSPEMIQQPESTVNRRAQVVDRGPRVFVIADYRSREEGMRKTENYQDMLDHRRWDSYFFIPDPKLQDVLKGIQLSVMGSPEERLATPLDYSREYAAVKEIQSLSMLIRQKMILA